MKRRDLLKNIGLGTAGVAVSSQGVAAHSVEPPKTPLKPLADVEGGFQKHEIERNRKLMAEVFFNDHEMKTITVLVDIIIPADSQSGSASQAGVPAFIEFIVKDMPHHQVPMRGGLMWLDIEAKKQMGKHFIALTSTERIHLVDQIAYPAKAKPEHSQGVSFFNLLRNLTATGFFTSEIGMKDVGYMGNTPTVWEGVPADVLAKHGLSYTEWEKHL